MDQRITPPPLSLPIPSECNNTSPFDISGSWSLQTGQFQTLPCDAEADGSWLSSPAEEDVLDIEREREDWWTGSVRTKNEMEKRERKKSRGTSGLWFNHLKRWAGGCGVKLWKLGVKPHTGCMNMSDLSMKANKGRQNIRAASCRTQASEASHWKRHVPFKQPNHGDCAWVQAQSVEFSLLKARQSDQIKTKKANVYAWLLKSTLYQSVRHSRYLWLGPSECLLCTSAWGNRGFRLSTNTGIQYVYSHRGILGSAFFRP